MLLTLQLNHQLLRCSDTNSILASCSLMSWISFLKAAVDPGKDLSRPLTAVCLCKAHTYEQQENQPAHARRRSVQSYYCGMTRSDGKVSAGTPQGSDTINGWED